MYKCMNCRWEFKEFKMIKTDWSQGMEGCPNCEITIMEGMFDTLDKIKPNNSEVKIIKFPTKE